MNFSEMPVAQVVGTDILFGIVLAFIGGAFHFLWGSINGAILLKLLLGGVPGVLIGCGLANKVPGRQLRIAIALIAIALGLQLAWTGAQSMLRGHNRAAATNGATTKVAAVTHSWH